MLPVIDVADVFATLYTAARTPMAECIVSHAAEVYYAMLGKGKPRTIGQCMHRAKLKCMGGRDFGTSHHRLTCNEYATELLHMLPDTFNTTANELREYLESCHTLASTVTLAWMNGDSMADIAERFDVSTMTVSRYVKSVCEELKEQFA